MLYHCVEKLFFVGSSHVSFLVTIRLFDLFAGLCVEVVYVEVFGCFYCRLKPFKLPPKHNPFNSQKETFSPNTIPTHKNTRNSQTSTMMLNISQLSLKQAHDERRDREIRELRERLKQLATLLDNRERPGGRGRRNREDMGVESSDEENTIPRIVRRDGREGND